MVPYFAEIVDENTFAELLDLATKLLRRSSSNMYIVKNLIAQSPIDLSFVANKIIFETLKDNLVTKEADQILVIREFFGELIKKCKDEKVIDELI